MNAESSYRSYNLDHLGLVAGMVDELGLPELIDTVIKQDREQRQVSVGQCVKAMVLNGLGFVNRTLYLIAVSDAALFQGQTARTSVGSGSGGRAS